MVKWVVLAFLAVMNLGAFAAYGIDKKIAQRNGLRDDDVDASRISEKALFLWALCGGALGALLGMKVWRHKTRHWYFVWGVPAILFAQLALGAWLAWKF
ncbi:DUF1294 domain-containing protein [Pyramidobacter sp. SM-530-WT-4B]|uniref:DUF1294 domain-containing protein n=1 Tax=Pyramidobacter porci TaxID=2605789 RepID=A0A6L5YFE4_9BACT|nr:DUF1294 domain-containing protein [Pyramidobacter porci]MCI6261421.1 DUF1294 domain-containing protein [Pyramidobacter sp.]MDY2647838.1 DUF1294 domain-containing protein [Pyramidobacter porci]MST56342.1 DUF1294 domain-containing protein [Pyramidobacter porci]